MSGPITGSDTPPIVDSPNRPATHQMPVVEVTAAREAPVGRATVRRALPRSGRRTVGAWCFADHFGPVEVDPTTGLNIGPHPHIGLHTVTWLLSGEVLHRDSLGSEQIIRPGQLNLMTAGRGVAHSEEGTGTYRGRVEGVQLWVAQPDSTCWGLPAFEHHADLPRVQLGRSAATVLVGHFGGQTSAARTDTPLVGVDVVLQAGGSEWPLRPDFEYALLVLDGTLRVEGQLASPDHLAYLGASRDHLTITATEPARLMLLGGETFPEPLIMWWNFVARDRQEVELATRQWNEADARFGVVASHLPRIPAPSVPPGLRT